MARIVTKGEIMSCGNAIFFITNNPDIVDDVTSLFVDAIKDPQFRPFTNNRGAAVAAISIAEAYNCFGKITDPEYPPSIQRAKRRLFVAFDTDGNDALHELQSCISDPNDWLSGRAKMHSITILPVSGALSSYCNRCNPRYDNIWIQKPPIGSVIYDRKLAERPLEYGIRASEFSASTERFLTAHVNRALNLKDLIGTDSSNFRHTVLDFWHMMEENSADTGIQAACVHSQFLLDYRGNLAPSIQGVNIETAYLQAIMTWIGRTAN